MRSYLQIGSRKGRAGTRALIAIPLLMAAILLLFTDCNAQNNPTIKIGDDVTRFAFSDGGRIAYSTRHLFTSRKIQLQRDDIWICEPDGKKHRILDGEKFVRGSGPFSYTVRAIRWSPDDTKIVVEIATTEMINDNGNTRDGVSTLLLDDSGREITTPAGDSMIAGASNGSWVGYPSGAAVIYLKEQVATPALPTKRLPPSPTIKLFSAILTRLATGAVSISGPNATLWGGQPFLAVDWEYDPTTGIAVEPGPNLTDTPRLVWLDIMSVSLTTRQLAVIEGYAGGLSLSPSGEKVAYWIDNGQLEIRDVKEPQRAARMLVPLGTLAWSGDETRVMVKRGPPNHSGSLAWYTLPTLATVAPGTAPAVTEVAPQSVLRDLEYRQFDISPNGKLLGVVEPGRQHLLVYPLT